VPERSRLSSIQVLALHPSPTPLEFAILAGPTVRIATQSSGVPDNQSAQPERILYIVHKIINSNIFMICITIPEHRRRPSIIDDVPEPGTLMVSKALKIPTVLSDFYTAM
jgi:hypothetical protein